MYICICMCIYIYIHTYVCMIYVYIYIVHASIHASIQQRACSILRISASTLTSIILHCVCMYVCMCISYHIYIYIYIEIDTRKHTYTHTRPREAAASRLGLLRAGRCQGYGQFSTVDVQGSRAKAQSRHKRT